MMKFFLRLLPFFIFSVQFFSCSEIAIHPIYKTRNVIIVVVDGARYSETWGDSSFSNIEYMHDYLSALGCINTNFYNNGPTYTLGGHTAITTGNYQEINNSGQEFPLLRSIFQIYNQKHARDSNLSWIISSKEKISVLADCLEPEWQHLHLPGINCGSKVSGVKSLYREDSLTFKESVRILLEYHPGLVLVSFKEPDFSAHQNNWKNYLKGISETDKYIYQLWNLIQNDSIYKEKTTFFVTNDHGRHLDSIANGFVSHGDGCAGCRHVFLFAAGPDFKQGDIITNKHELTDIPFTIAELLRFDLPHGQGNVMYELFK